VSDTAVGVRALQHRVSQAAPFLVMPHSTRADPLADVIVAIAKRFGLNADPLSLTSGLSLVEGRLTIQSLHDLAERAGLDVRLLASGPRGLRAEQCPALAKLADGSIALIDAVSSGGDLTLAPLAPEQPRRQLPASQCAADVVAIYLVRPICADQAAEDAQVSALLPQRIRRSNAWLYSEALIATAVINSLALAIPLYTMNIYDRVLPTGALTTLIALSIGVGLAGLLDFVMKSVRGLLIDIASRRSDLLISMNVFSRLLGAKLTAAPSAVGVRANTLREIETIREFNTSVTLAALGDLPFALLFLVVIGIVGGPLIWVPLIAMPVVIALVLALQGPIDRMTEAAQRHMSQKSGVLVETLSGLETLKGLGAESWAATRWEKAVADQLRLSTMMRFCSGLGMGLVGFGQIASTVAMIVAGVLLVGDGTITAGALMASVMLMSRAMQPVGQVAALAGKLHSVRLARRALKGVLDAAQERAPGRSFVTLPEFQGAISFENVTLNYADGSPPALDRVSFSIAAGERVGILGAIGSGKSSLFRLATKLNEPSSGRILIDGLALASIDPASLRARIGFLSQDATLFQGTIRENLIIHRPLADDAQIIAAAEQSGALSWISRLGKGFDAPLGERGQGLSGGQKRSLALARTLIGAPRLLLLDEPTSEMDGRSEQDVVDRIKRLLPGRTLLLVTHKPATLDLVDRLIVVDQGRIMADGPKEAVLAELRRQSTDRKSSRPVALPEAYRP
jgi:ATP-binding cassette, subfamily C, bacterial LapB